MGENTTEKDLRRGCSKLFFNYDTFKLSILAKVLNIIVDRITESST